MLQAAHALDLKGNKAARGQIAAAKALAPSAVLAVIDRAIQVRPACIFWVYQWYCGAEGCSAEICLSLN